MAGTGCCRPGYRRDLCSLYEALTRDPSLWDKRLLLNSDGRRLFESLARLLLEEHPEHRRLVHRARREPTWENIARMAVLSFYACAAPRPPWLEQPYRWRRPRPWPRQGGRGEAGSPA